MDMWARIDNGTVAEITDLNPSRALSSLVALAASRAGRRLWTWMAMGRHDLYCPSRPYT